MSFLREARSRAREPLGIGTLYTSTSGALRRESYSFLNLCRYIALSIRFRLAERGMGKKYFKKLKFSRPSKRVFHLSTVVGLSANFGTGRA